MLEENAGEGLEGSGPGYVDVVAALSPKQQMVMQNMVATGNLSEAARQAGVGRRTVYHWIKDDERFEAAFNAWRREILRLGRARALGMAEAALDTIKAAIEKGNASIALQVAKALGLLTQKKIGPEEPGEVGMARARAHKTRRVKIAQKDRALIEAGGDKRKPPKDIYEIDDRIAGLLEERRQALKVRDAGDAEDAGA